MPAVPPPAIELIPIPPVPSDGAARAKSRVATRLLSMPKGGAAVVFLSMVSVCTQRTIELKPRIIPTRVLLPGGSRSQSGAHSVAAANPRVRDGREDFSRTEEALARTRVMGWGEEGSEADSERSLICVEPSVGEDWN
ncbi:hypothetical protein CDAR_535391 [Caerostris darwini]|uniref:Uncharacterized protein n=1 Tax=Caerostris darwini TaxID=1538125 RepID=A0AAV4V3U8_9ARAC|nr:hypothetical protein CDAR_535391 [Caerostris darwini]